MSLSGIDELYEEKKRIYERAMKQAAAYIADIIRDFAEEGLFRVARPPEFRLKTLDSLKRKARVNSVPPEQVFDKTLDMAGIRIIVHNLSDIETLAEKIKTSSKLEFDPSACEDYIATPLESGYRARHFVAHVEVEFKGKTYRIPGEIQVRTLLQDSWAIFVHEDIYKSSEALPPVIQKLSRRLADQLAVMDQTAQDIRDELSKKVEPTGAASDGDPLTKQTVGIILSQLMSREPREYELQYALNEFNAIGLGKVEDLKRSLPDDTIRQRLAELHRRFFNGWPIDEFDAIVWGTKVMVEGNRAYSEFAEKVKGEWIEVETIARREILSELPETLEGLIDELGCHDESGGYASHGLLHALRELGGTLSCGLCGTEILAPDSAYEVLCEHYGVEECDELLDQLNQVCADGIAECEDVDHPEYCPHCAHLLYGENT